MISAPLKPTPASVGPVTPCLAMRPAAAAEALGISERTLWTMTQQRKLPHIRLGKVILYPCDALRRWLDEQAAKAPATEGEDDDCR